MLALTKPFIHPPLIKRQREDVVSIWRQIPPPLVTPCCVQRSTNQYVSTVFTSGHRQNEMVGKIFKDKDAFVFLGSTQETTQGLRSTIPQDRIPTEQAQKTDIR